MALRIEQKQEIVAEVSEAAGSALSAVLADYRGMTVGDFTDLRRQARESGVYLRVVRNSLLKRAVAGTAFECLRDACVGPTILAFSQEDPGAAARLLKDAAAQYEPLQVKAVSIGGRAYAAEDIDRVASLPSRDEAIAQLMAVLQAPVAKLARTLQEVPAKLVRTLQAVREQKEPAGDSLAAP